MSLYTEIQQAIEDVAKMHGEATDEENAIPQTIDELKSRATTLQSEFRQVLEAEAATKRGEQR